MPDNGRSALDHEFTEYVAARQHALLRTAYVLTGDRAAAEDLLQTALAKTYLAWSRIRERDAVDAYVRKTMLNEHTSWWRRAWRHREQLTEHPPDAARSNAVAADPDERDAMWTLVQSLPPRQRAAVVLRFYEDMSEAETAAVLGCAVGTVKSQTSRALATLRGRLAAPGQPTTSGGTR